MMKHTVLNTPHQPSDMHPIQIDEGEFAGCQVIFGALSFGGTDEEPILKFDYEIVNDYNVNESRIHMFEQNLGELITQILVESIERQEVIYKGGE